MFFVEIDPHTGETGTFGGIAEAAAEYHARGEMCPWDCWRCDPDNPANWPEGYDPYQDDDQSKPGLHGRAEG